MLKFSTNLFRRCEIEHFEFQLVEIYALRSTAFWHEGREDIAGPYHRVGEKWLEIFLRCRCNSPARYPQVGIWPEERQFEKLHLAPRNGLL